MFTRDDADVADVFVILHIHVANYGGDFIWTMK